MEAQNALLKQRILELEEEGEKLRERALADREECNVERARASELETARQVVEVC